MASTIPDLPPGESPRPRNQDDVLRERPLRVRGGFP